MGSSEIGCYVGCLVLGMGHPGKRGCERRLILWWLWLVCGLLRGLRVLACGGDAGARGVCGGLRVAGCFHPRSWGDGGVYDGVHPRKLCGNRVGWRGCGVGGGKDWLSSG